MTEDERKMVAYLAGKLLEVVLYGPHALTWDDRQALENIARELGYFSLDDEEFRY